MTDGQFYIIMCFLTAIESDLSKRKLFILAYSLLSVIFGVMSVISFLAGI